MKGHMIAIVAILGVAHCKVMQFPGESTSKSSGGSLVKFEDHQSPQQRTLSKPAKLDTSPIMAHPYQYEGPDTFPYQPVVNPAYTPPILQESTSKLDHFGYGDHLHPVDLGNPHHSKQVFGELPPQGQHPWQKLLRVMTAAIPIGLFLAALPPNVVYLNTAQPTTKPLGTTQSLRQRSNPENQQAELMHTFPVLDLIERAGGLPALEKPECEAFIFCSMARLGSSPTANTVQKFLWTTAHGTPEALAEMLGVRELMKAVRTDSCSIYKCPAQQQQQ